MTPVSEIALETMHATATEIFTGAVAACNIASAFDRRIRFEGHRLHRLSLIHIFGSHELGGKYRKVAQQPAAGIVLQPVEAAPVHDQQVARIFNHHAVPGRNVNRTAPGRNETLAVPTVKVFVCAHPNRAVGVQNNGMDIQFGDALFGAEAFKAGAEKPVDAVLRAQPQKPGTVGRQCIDRKVLEPLGLAVSAKDILLRLQGGGKRQPTNHLPN